MKNKMDTHYESLSRLYLRLKGFLTSNLIIHSDNDGNSRTELDILAVKMPYHSQDYRWVNVADFLGSTNSRIEIIIADVKNHSKIETVKFNSGLRKDKESIRQLIEWIGVYKSVNDEQLERFTKYLNLHQIKDLNGFAQFDEDLKLGKFRFKFTFFCPSLAKWDGIGFKYIDGQEMIDFIWECLNEVRKIETCSRRYDFGGWNELDVYVRFFKGKLTKVTLQDFENYCNSLK